MTAGHEYRMTAAWLAFLGVTAALPGVAAEVLGFEAPVTTITTSEIAAASLSFDCLDYKVTGVCIWLECNPFGCSIETTPKICHYLPDIVVSSYHRSEQNPWVEMSSVSAAAQGVGTGIMGAGVPIDGGTRSEGKARREDKGMPVKEVSVIGNPIAGAADFAGVLCPSQSIPFLPYFLSQLDAWPWRSALTEIIYPATFIPGLREIGEWPLNTWGSVHPRIGTVIQTEEPKAAAVTCQRAVDIVTREGQPHAYVPLSGDAGEGGEPPGPSDEQTDRWQMLRPPVQGACETFGSNDPFWSAAGKVSPDEAYVWNYWRKYHCCIEGPGLLIAAIGECPSEPKR